ncbi:hypothetical protein D3C75_378860 [compost metagenome]
MYRVHTFHQEQAEVHQVTVTPATVALQLIQQVRRQLFIGARQVVGNPHPPTGTTHQRRFYEVMRQNRTGKRAFARQRGQRTVLNERLHADDGVVPPVVGLAQLPEVQARSKQRPVDAGRKLLATRIQSIHARRLRRGLDDPGIRVGFHQTHQPGQTVAGHHGVGVQHHHIAVLVAPATTEVIDVATFTLHAAAAAAIENLPFALHFSDQLHPRFLLSHANIGVVAVTQDVDVEMCAVPGRFYRLPGGAQARENAIHVFVTDRHNQRGTVFGIECFIPHRRRGDTVLIPANQQLQEAHQRGPETGRHPAEENGKQQKNAAL